MFHRNGYTTMSRVLVSSLMLLFLTTAAYAQPSPGDPAQLSVPIMVTDGVTPNTLFFGLDVRATAGRDADPGLKEPLNIPPVPPAMEARFVIVASNLESKHDYRFGDGQDQVETYKMLIRRSTLLGASNDMTISWSNLPSYVTGVVTEPDGGAQLAVINGTGSVQVQTNTTTGIKVVDLIISYTDIDEGILPVELTSFDAIVQDNRAVLRWETASETNNAGFEVQQRIGGTFQTIGFVEGRGTTTNTQRYSYRTRNLAAGNHEFRLKQIDFDGTFAFSGSAMANIALTGAAVMDAAHPNPFNPQTQFTLTIAREQDVAIYVYDMQGRQLATLFQGTLGASEAHPFTFEASNLPSGRYFIRAVGEFFNQSQTVTLLK